MHGSQKRPSNPFTPFKKEDIEQSLPSRFEQMVDQYHDRLAIKDKIHGLTYRKLNQKANKIAHAILEQSEGQQTPIALFFEQSSQAIIAILGVLKAGNFYLPLEPNAPRNRLFEILDNAQAKIFLTNSRNLPILTSLALPNMKIICVDDLHADFTDRNPGVPISPDRLAYIFYTSGSSGRPKGVMDTHRNVLHNVLRYTNTLHIGHNDRLSLIQSTAFSGTVSSTFGALLNGASVFPLDLPSYGVSNLVDWLIQQKITIYHSVPSLFRNLTFGNRQFPYLRLIRLEGDQAFKQDVELYQQFFSPHCILVNGLGATECGLIRQNFVNKESLIPSGALPIGYPVDDMEVLLLDDFGQEVGPGRTGEIAVKSPYMSPGYWRQPELTQNAFRPIPGEGKERIYFTGDLGRMLPDGCMTHVGRKDFRVKVKGHRVEVAEVEMALLECDGVQEAVVTTREDRIHDQRLVGYIVLLPGHFPQFTSLRNDLARKLPDYMIPTSFVFLERLPLTAAGKLDRRRLPAPGNERPKLDIPYVPPQTPIEKEVAKIWSEILGLNEVGVHDPFLELGGDSLRATQVISRVLDRYQVRLLLVTLFDTPTIAEMADVILKHKSN